LEAARQGDRSTLEALVARGIDIDTRDEDGRTALFSAIAPFGGDPPLVAWLLERGANPNVRDARGMSALEVGFGAVTSGLEANMMAHLGDAFRAHGYRREEDFVGVWYIAEGPDAGRSLMLDKHGIESDVVSLRLTASDVTVDDLGRLRAHGDHAGTLVHLVVSLEAEDRARLNWSDGVTHPAELVLHR
jgi:hypothetical protein